MSERKQDSAGDGLNAQVEAAERRLREASEAAATAEQRATAEIQALEADLERERREKQAAISAAESRLADIEKQAEAAERRVEEAQRKASDAEGSNADLETRAREAAAAWLRGQIEALRQGAEGR